LKWTNDSVPRYDGITNSRREGKRNLRGKNRGWGDMGEKRKRQREMERTRGST